MKLGYTILYVEDVERTLDFYNQAFGFTVKFLHESKDYGELDTGETTLAFSSLSLIQKIGKSPSAANSQHPCFEIALITEDINAALEKAVNAGAKLINSPEKMPWDQTIAYVADPDGFLIEICTPVTSR